MACNIIMGESGTLRTTQFSATTQYNIDDMNFYIPKIKAEASQVFLILKNDRNLYEIVELVRSRSAQGTNLLYKLPLKQALRVNNEQVVLSLMLIDTQTGEYSYSTQLKAKISTDNYLLARQVYIAQQVGQKVQDLYVKVLGLTEENREIYKKIQEGEDN